MAATLLSPFFVNPSSGCLSLCFRSLDSDHLRGHPLRALHPLDGDLPFDDGEEWEEGDEVEGEGNDASSDEYPSDVESLEEEARNVAQEYALSVSCELGRGIQVQLDLKDNTGSSSKKPAAMLQNPKSTEKVGQGSRGGKKPMGARFAICTMELICSLDAQEE